MRICLANVITHMTVIAVQSVHDVFLNECMHRIPKKVQQCFLDYIMASSILHILYPSFSSSGHANSVVCDIAALFGVLKISMGRQKET